ncbi:MAG: PEP-CTERM sorting domain-containing protein [Puniceicoccales bacterium]
MKTKHYIILCIAMSGGALSSSLIADVLIYDDFGLPSDPNSNLDGRTPVTGPNDWYGYSAGSDVGWKVYGGEALLGDLSKNGMAGISMGDDYFSTNPAVYSLSANLSMTPSTGESWYAIGFNEEFSTSSNTGFYNPDEVEGQPWLFVRNNGEVQVRYDEDNYMYSGSGFDVSDMNLELILDTSVAQWTVDAYIDGVQLDLNGAAAGSTYTYSTNPSSIGSVGLSGTAGVVGTIQDFTLQTVPEPQAFALLFGLGALCVVVTRRRR